MVGVIDSQLDLLSQRHCPQLAVVDCNWELPIGLLRYHYCKQLTRCDTSNLLTPQWQYIFHCMGAPRPQKTLPLPLLIHSSHSYQTFQTLHLKNIHFLYLRTSHTPCFCPIQRRWYNYSCIHTVTCPGLLEQSTQKKRKKKESQVLLISRMDGAGK